MIQKRLTCVVLICGSSLFFSCEFGFGFQSPDSADQNAVLNDASFPVWRDRIRATESELEWQNLPWTTSFHEGLRRAGDEGKPLLLWVMNGHPMGCT